VRKIVIVSLLVLLVAVTASAGTVVVNFDDLTGAGLVPDGYGGINWSGNWTYYDSAQPPYNPSSPPSRVYDSNVAVFPQDTFSFVNPAGEVFLGAWFAGYPEATITFNLFNGANLVWTSNTLAPTDVPAFLTSGYSGLVTSVQVLSPEPDTFVMDDVTYSTVPEPTSLMLLGTGLMAGIGAIRRKHRA